jgi:hypothetical protein
VRDQVLSRPEIINCEACELLNAGLVGQPAGRRR